MDWWRIHRKALSEAQCLEVRRLALQYPVVDGTIGYGGGQRVVAQMRKSTVRWLSREDASLQWLYRKMERLMLESNQVTFGLDIAGQCGGFTSVQFTEYHGDTQQHYDWHEDNNWKLTAPFDRKLSMVIQLSKPEEYEGGRLELYNDPLPVDAFRDQGDVILFPSFNRHRVTPVTSGDRYSLVTWFVGPRLR